MNAYSFIGSSSFFYSYCYFYIDTMNANKNNDEFQLPSLWSCWCLQSCRAHLYLSDISFFKWQANLKRYPNCACRISLDFHDYQTTARLIDSHPILRLYFVSVTVMGHTEHLFAHIVFLLRNSNTLVVDRAYERFSNILRLSGRFWVNGLKVNFAVASWRKWYRHIKRCTFKRNSFSSACLCTKIASWLFHDGTYYCLIMFHVCKLAFCRSLSFLRTFFTTLIFCKKYFMVCLRYGC